MDREDTEAMLNIVRQHLRGPAPALSAFRIAHELETALNADTSERGSGLAPTDHNELDEWVTTAEAAKLLDCSEGWARAIARSGKIGAVPRGGRWWIPRSSLPEPEGDT